MTVTYSAGLPLVVVSVVLLAWSFSGQHAQAAAMSPLSLRRPFASLRLLFSNLRWLSAYLTGWLGWAAYVAALRYLPLSVTQGISAAGMALLAVLSHHRIGHLEREELFGTAASFLGLVLVFVALPTVGHGHAVHNWRVASVVVVGLMLAAVAASPGRALVGAGAALGIAAGLCYGVGDVATKAAVDGSSLLFVPAFLLCHLVGFVATQLAYQRGSLLETAGVSSLLTNAIPIVAGFAIYGEFPLRGSGRVIELVGLVLAVVGGALLARHGRPETLVA